MRWLFLVAALAACATAPKPALAPAQDGPGGASPEAARPAVETPWVRTPPPAALPALARARPVARTQTLKNGLRVVVVEDHRVRLVKTRLFLPSGSAADQEDLAGATWFALALLGDTFDERDSDERPVRVMERSARYLAMMAGAHLHFDVSPDSSWIGLDGYAVDTPNILRRLDLIVSERRHGPDSFQARAQGVTDLVNELELTDGLVLEQYLTQLAFGAAHPYARPVFGTNTSIGRIGIEDVAERQRQLLTPVGSTLLVAGDVDSDDVFRRAQAAFGDWRGEAVDRAFVPPPAVTKRRSVVFLPRRPSRNTLICLTRPLTDVKESPEATALAVAVLGASRMSAVLREKLGLTYSITSAMVERRSARALLICTRVVATETINATRLMLEELAALKTTAPTADELERVRAMAITEVATAQDDLAGIVESWRWAAAMRLPAPPENRVEALRQVTLEEVTAVAKKLASTDTVQIIFSGERPLVEAAARANSLGPLKVPSLGRVSE